MSYLSLDAASKDQALSNRVIACAQQEARNDPTFADTTFADVVIANPAEGIRLIWPVALAGEAEYAAALAAGIANPGADEAVITDGMILSAVQASWPDDVEEPPT
jgi:hypothetical protein